MENDFEKFVLDYLSEKGYVSFIELKKASLSFNYSDNVLCTKMSNLCDDGKLIIVEMPSKNSPFLISFRIYLNLGAQINFDGRVLNI